VLATQFPTGDIVILCLLLIGAICVLGVLVWLARRMLLPSRSGDLSDEWSLQHLRELHAGGHITTQEFEVLKQRVIAAVQGDESRKDGAAPPSKDGPPPPEQ
jgi:hypothetical protein